MNNESKVTRFGRPRRRRSLLASSACALAFSLAFSVAVLLVFAFVAYRSDDPTRLLVPLSVGALAAASFVCGIAAARFRRGQGLVAGILSGALFALTVAIASFAFSGVAAPAVERPYLLYAAIPLLAGFGGIVANGRGERRTKRPHRR